MIYLLKWWLSIVMLVYQRVFMTSPITSPFYRILPTKIPCKIPWKKSPMKSPFDPRQSGTEHVEIWALIWRGWSHPWKEHEKPPKKNWLKHIKTLSHFLMPLKAFPLFFLFPKFSTEMSPRPLKLRPRLSPFLGFRRLRPSSVEIWSW